MRCPTCDKHLRLEHQRVEVDTLVKFYECSEGHRTIYRRFGKCYSINNKIHYVDEEYQPSNSEPTRP